MTTETPTASATTPAASDTAKSSRRDWLILPLIALLTVWVIIGGLEATGKAMFSVSSTSALKCLVLNDESTGVRAKPNSVCSEKIGESDLTEYRYNARGHREDYDYGPKPPGTFRIVLVGSSFSEGLWTPRERTFAALLPQELYRATGRKVELYNEGMQWGTPRSVDLRFNDVLAAKPDMVLWSLTPWDIDNSSLLVPFAAFADQVQAERASRSVKTKAENLLKNVSIPQLIMGSWLRAVGNFDSTYTSMLLKHFLFKSQSQYLKQYTMQTDSSGFLLTQSPPLFLDDLNQFDGYAAEISAKAKAAGVPLVVVLLPQRAQAAMISVGSWPAGFDPYKLGEEIRQPIERQGETYVDILHDFKSVPNPERLYYPVDGHIDADAHALIAKMLARELIAQNLLGQSAPAANSPAKNQATLHPPAALSPIAPARASGREP